MSTATEGDGGFLTFYREYAHTGIHTVTATALTAFGLLSFVHRGFVALAIAVYVLPPIYLYLTRDGEAPKPIGEDATASEAAGSGSDASQPTSVTGSGNTDAGSTDDATPEPDTGTEPREDARGTPGTGSPNDGGPDLRRETEAGSTGRNGVEDRGDGSEPTDDPPATERAESETETGSGSPMSDGSEGGDAGSDPESAGGATDADGDREAETGPAEWVATDSPTEETLFDAVTAGSRAYVVGANGVLLARSGDGDWELALEHGPAAESTTLRGVDATAEGDAVWVAGDGGVLGRYDPETGRHTDHSAPRGITDNWAALAVAGTAGEERVALANGSGQVLLGSYGGSEVEWDEPVKPGSGSSMSAIEFVDDSTGYCCDTNAGVDRVRNGEFARIGIEDASGFSALAATEDAVAVASDDGTVQRFDGSVWTPVRVSDGALSGLDTDGEEWLAAGAGGTLYENRGGGWEATDSPTEADLFAVASGDLPVAVGEGGTVLERM